VQGQPIEVPHDLFKLTSANENAGGPHSVGAKGATGDGGHPRDPPFKAHFIEVLLVFSHASRLAALFPGVALGIKSHRITL